MVATGTQGPVATKRVSETFGARNLVRQITARPMTPRQKNNGTLLPNPQYDSSKTTPEESSEAAILL